jgi:hypothetical protein
MSEKKTLRNIREAQDALAKAQAAMEKAQQGLATAESVTETEKRPRKHPVVRTVIVLAIGLAAVLVFVGFNKSGDG